MRLYRSNRTARRGTISVEMAFMAPLLMFFAVIGVDYARIFSRALILETASRNGCWYACQDATHAADTANIQAVALKDLTDVTPTPTVTSSTYVGADGFTYVRVTCSMTFTTITNYPAVPSSSNLSRYTDMRVCPTTPKPGTF
jgi:Flp pilus assembly protein TadG